MTIARFAPVFVLCLFPAAAFAQAAEPAIVFGARHALALRTNGDVLSWGENVGCQLGRRAGNRDATPAIVMRNAKQIAAASDHSLVLTTDGKVYGWGTNPEGALGAGNTNDQCEGPLLIPSLADKTIAHIATGVGFSVALTTTGELYCTGDNSMGQCAAGRTGRLEAFVAMPLPDLAGRVVAIKAGGFHTLLLTSNGTLHAVGRGRDGQLGHGKTVNGAGAVSELHGRGLVRRRHVAQRRRARGRQRLGLGQQRAIAALRRHDGQSRRAGPHRAAGRRQGHAGLRRRARHDDEDL